MADFYYNSKDILDKAMGTDSYSQIKSILFGLKAADVVEVVRCRECKHWEDWGACGHTDNGFDSPPMGPDDFCSKGERSTD